MHKECYVPVMLAMIIHNVVDERCIVVDESVERLTGGCRRNSDFIDDVVCAASGLWSVVPFGAGPAASRVVRKAVWR